MRKMAEKKIRGKIYKFFDDRFGEAADEELKKEIMKEDMSFWEKLYLTLGSPGYLLPGDAVKRMFSNDPEVRKLQRKSIMSSAPGFNDPDDELGVGAMLRKGLQDKTDKPFDEVCKKGVPKYIYEPNVRYKKVENPDYKRHRNYSMAGILTGTGLLATGLASFNYALAYAGAALTLASFGYQSGHWFKKRKTDQIFEKLPLSLSELEKKAQKPGNPDSHYRSNHAGSLSDITAKESYKDDALYVRRLYTVQPPRGKLSTPYSYTPRWPFHYASIDRWKSRTEWGLLGAALTALCLASAPLWNANSAVTAAQSLLAAGSIGLATLGHYVGYIFGGKDAPEYQKVSGLEEKD